MKPRAPLSKLPNAARAKKGKVSAKKNKEADGSSSSKLSRKKLAGRATDAAATEAPASSLVERAADAHKVFDEMPQSFNDEAYMSTMGVGSNNSHWSQTNDIHFDDHEFEVDEDGEGIVDAPKGRGGNYTNDEDLNIAQNLFNGEEKKSKKGRPFTLPHCYEALKDDEKWKKFDDTDDVDESNKRKRTIDLDEEEEASGNDGKRSPTPNSVSYSKPKRPDGCKKDAKEKKKRKGDDEFKNAMEAIVKARKEANEVRKMARNQDAAAEERRVAAEERKVALKERKVAMEERTRLMEWEKYLFFMDTSILNEAQKGYVNLAREEVLIQKRAMIRGGMGGMGGGGIGGMGGGGIGGMGGIGGFGAIMGGMGAMGGFGATMETMGGMGGFRAPPGGMGGMGDLANIFRASHDDAARDNEEEEEESSSGEDDESEEDEDEDEDET
nr:aspartate, glycine, lysine and serine-rich protein-like [Aegilops tauschii subsp. strangulata]